MWKIILICGLCLPGFASPKSEGTALLNQFMDALLIQDFQLSARAVAQLVHPDLRSKNGKTLSRDLREFSFRKAHTNARWYAHPVRIARMRKYDQRAYTGGATPEPGVLYDFFLARKDKGTGLPAPIRIFFPRDDRPPMIVYLGNL